MTRSLPSGPPALRVLVLLAAGCLAGPGSPIALTPDGDGTASTPGTTTASELPDRTAKPPPDATATSPPAATSPPGDASVEYVVRAGAIPEDLASVTATFQVVFVEREADLGPCYPDVFTGPYKPTITPLATPSGDCRRSEPVRVDLAELEGERSLGTFAVPASTAGHALLVTDVVATHENGSTVTAIRGTGGVELLAAPGRPGDAYAVSIGLEPARDDASYDYWLVAERIHPGASSPGPSS